MKTDCKNFIAVLLVLVLFAAVFAYSAAGENFIQIYKIYAFYFFMGAVLLIAGLQLVLSYYKPPSFFKINVIDALLTGWLVYISINVLVKRDGWDNNKLIVLFLCISAYFVVRMMLLEGNTGVFKKLVVYGLTITGILQALVGLLQFYGLLHSLNSSFSLTGTFKNPAPFALFLGVCLPVSASVVLFLSGKRSATLRLLSWINIMLIIVVLPLTGIRAAWISAIAGVVFIVGFKYRITSRWAAKFNGSRTRVYFIGIAILLVLLPAGIFIYRLKPTSADGRILIWQITLDRFWDAPITGVGYNRFNELYDKWQVTYFTNHPEVLNRNYSGSRPVSDFAGYVKMPYNEFLEIAVEQGIVGLSIFLCLTVAALKKAFAWLKRKRSIFLAANAAGLLTLLIAGLISYPFYSLPTFFLFFIFLAFISSETTVKSASTPGRNYSRVVFGLVFLACSVMLISRDLLYADKYGKYLYAKRLYREDDKAAAEQQYAGIFPYLNNDPVYLLDYGICLIDNKKYSSAFKMLSLAEQIDNDPRIFMLKGNILLERNQYKESEYMYNYAHLIIPSRIFPEYLLAKLYEQSKDTVKAVSMAKRILNKPVKTDNQLSESIQSEMHSLLKKLGAEKDE